MTNGNIDDMTDAWTLWKERFKVGDWVILIDDLDKMWRGKITGWTPTHCTLVSPNRSRDFAWDEMRFACHDGFPVRKLLGADGHPSIEDEEHLAATIRAEWRDGGFASQGVFGDPFLIEDVTASVVNPGNFDYNSDYEEVLLLESDDGAKGMLWDFQTVFFIS